LARDTGNVMREYYFYFLDHDSQIKSTKITYCADDLDAVKFAQQLKAPSDIEVWQGLRLVKRLNAMDNRVPKARGAA
jgi:hypothetical protein